MINLAIFISGAGSNAKKIIQHFYSNNSIKVKLVVTNNSESGFINTLDKSVSYKIFSKKDILEGGILLRELQKNKISFIILAGFILKISSIIIEKFRHKIINIHPSLLPDFGGKGMYGMNVHKAVFMAKKKETGITIHKVNKEYDKGQIIFQARCEILQSDQPTHIQRKVQKLEHKFYPIVIENYINSNHAN